MRCANRSQQILGIGMVPGVAILLVVGSGCQSAALPTGNPCAGFDCDDGDSCTIDACTVVDGEAVCTRTAVECAEGLVCRPTTGACEEPECSEDADCAAEQICGNGVCVEVECVTADDCDDDGLFCTGDRACQDNVCGFSGNPCAEGETCDDDLDACVRPTEACRSDGDCDDGLFCNGAEACVDDLCVAGTNPCSTDEACEEDRDACALTAIGELKIVQRDLGDCGLRVNQFLSSPPGPDAPGPELNNTLGKLAALGDELTALDRRAGSVMDAVADSHLRDTSQLMGPLVRELDDVQAAGQDVMNAFDRFVESASPEFVAPAFLESASSIRSRIQETVFVVGFRYYRHYIPVRFVQFIEEASQVLSDEWLQHSIDVANHVFFPARIRLFIRENNFIASYHFADLDLRNPDRTYQLERDGRRKSGDYTWPEDLRTAAPIRGIYYPDLPDDFPCLVFRRPPGNTERRDHAQMRAGTYCCPDGEMLVYINQGRSNGGQYPWYSRIIGMSSGHMADPSLEEGKDEDKFVFAHEVGHYLGLPHVFPDHNVYDPDYDLARMTGELGSGDPPPDQRRYYGTHANLRNVEPGLPVDIINPDSGRTAELSLFWDMVFKPAYDGGDHVFFSSREAAAQWEADLQPIEQWGNVQVCWTCCGAIPYSARWWQPVAATVRLRHVVAAGCRGLKGEFGDCASAVQNLCTGDPGAQAFSRYGSTQNKIHVNVMSYRYQMTDGTNAPMAMLEDVFVSASQLEQIDRVMTHDVKTRFFPEIWGQRPQLGTCTSCHSH